MQFCRWYVAPAEPAQPNPRKIGRFAAAAGLMARFGFKKEAEELFEKAFADMLTLDRDEYSYYTAEPIVRHRIGTGDYESVLKLFERMSENGFDISIYLKIDWLCEMGKFDEAIALSEENQHCSHLWEEIGEALVITERKDEAKKIFEKAIEHELATPYPDPGLVHRLLQVGMIDEAFRYIPRLNNAENRISVLTMIAQKQRTDGNTDAADKTLLEAVKVVEEMVPQHVSHRLGVLGDILSHLMENPKLAQRWEKMMFPNGRPRW
jgi:tetratricopeptide (TPR) repeat protein